MLMRSDVLSSRGHLRSSQNALHIVRITILRGPSGGDALRPPRTSTRCRKSLVSLVSLVFDKPIAGLQLQGSRVTMLPGPTSPRLHAHLSISTAHVRMIGYEHLVVLAINGPKLDL